MRAAIEIHGLKKSFGGRTVLDIPELVLEEGSRTALIGPNGSGKSTLLRILAGVIAPDEGEVKVNVPLSYMPQKPYCFGFSAEKNVALAVKRGADAKGRAADALEAVGLTPLRTGRGSLLSGGEAQRMAFARILAARERLVLLDEPTSAVDLAGARSIETALNALLEELSGTLLFATHAPAQAAALSTEIVVLSGGKIAERGETGQVLYDPQSECAETFLSNWRL